MTIDIGYHGRYSVYTCIHYGTRYDVNDLMVVTMVVLPLVLLGKSSPENHGLLTSPLKSIKIMSHEAFRFQFSNQVILQSKMITMIHCDIGNHDTP